jgi:hypothetical protein
MFSLLLQALFVKTISHAPSNAKAILGLKVIDFVVKLFAMPHINKEAYFDDIWAQVLNIIQIAGITAYVETKYGDALDSVGSGQASPGTAGFGGDALGQLFMATTIAGIFPNIMTALKESYNSLAKLVDQMRSAKDSFDEKQEQLMAMKEQVGYAPGFVEKARIIFGPKKGAVDQTFNDYPMPYIPETRHMQLAAPRTAAATYDRQRQGPRPAVYFAQGHPRLPGPAAFPKLARVTGAAGRADVYARAGYEIESVGSADTFSQQGYTLQ